ncbi:MAG: histidinol-phosphate transaminase [Clostridiales bacterium]|nr:histidinol-phosphate transaminase [Clostridiales bacterium]
MVRQRNIINSLSPYIPGKPIDEVQREQGIDRVIKMASNENPLGNSPLASKAVEEWAKNMAQYPDGNSTRLKENLSRALGVESDQLLLGSGTDQILEYIAETYINPEDNSIMGHPSFPRYETVVKVMDGEVIRIPLTANHCLDLNAFLANINHRTKVIWICNPNNPTGTIITDSEQRAFLNKVPKDVLVVLDEAYYEYASGGDYPESIKYLNDYPNLLILRTFSKVYGLAGLRIGYAISNRDTIGYINRVRGPFNTNTAAQIAAIASLGDEAFVRRSIKTNIEGREYLYAAFKNLGLKFIPTYANFLMVKVNLPSDKVFRSLLKKGVIIRSGDIFGMDDWIRVTIGTMEENKFFIHALNEVIHER